MVEAKQGTGQECFCYNVNDRWHGLRSSGDVEETLIMAAGNDTDPEAFDKLFSMWSSPGFYHEK